MIDFNRIIGLVFDANSSVLYNKIRRCLLDVSGAIQDDDYCLSQGKGCFGKAELFAAIANSKAYTKRSDFVETVKETVKYISSLDTNATKLIIIICNEYTNELEHTISKLYKMNEKSFYPPKILMFELTQESPAHNSHRTIISDVTELAQQLESVLDDIA